MILKNNEIEITRFELAYLTLKIVKKFILASLYVFFYKASKMMDYL